MIPGTNPDLFTRIAFYAFQATLLVVFLSWLLRHLLDTLQVVIIRLRKVWAAIRRELPEEPRRATSSSP